MPLNVQIMVNGDEIATIHIGNMGRIPGEPNLYEYEVTAEEWPQTLYEGKPRSYRPRFNTGQIERSKETRKHAYFWHYRPDGAAVCVRKALQALEEVGYVV